MPILVCHPQRNAKKLGEAYWQGMLNMMLSETQRVSKQVNASQHPLTDMRSGRWPGGSPAPASAND
eukprot:3626911-Pyramimonas_sp.AAC.2